MSASGSLDRTDTDSEKTLKVTALEGGVDAAVAKRDVERSYVINLRESLSPVRRLPPEILLEIFVLLSETIIIPPRLMQIPWILGRVCSQWRTLSRRHPRLWGHPNIGEDHIVNLNYVFNILPPAVNINLYCTQESADPKHLYPYLSRCRIIRFYGTIQFIDDLCRNAPADAFHNLAIFGLSARPSRNSLGPVSDSVSLQGQLHSATHLEEFDLSIGEAGELAVKSLMSLDIPYSQLKILKLTINVDIPTLSRFLQQCYSIVELDVVFRPISGESYTSCKYDNYLYLPGLRKLRLHQTTLWIQILRGNWQNLRYFWLNSATDGATCSADTLHEVLEQCASLECLRLIVPLNFPLKRLAMPVLRFMDVSYREPAGVGPFDNFFVPSLEYLRIEVYPNCEPDFSTLSAMFECSQCHLSRFKLHNSHWLVRRMPFLCDIFPSISHSIDAVILINTALDADILREIGSRRLLPKLKVLRCYAESGRAILDTIEARILRDTSDEGEERTWRFDCYTSAPPDSPEADLLQQLCLMHGIDVKIARWSWVITRGLVDELPGYPFPSFA